MVCNDQDNVDNYLKNEGQIEDNNAKQQFQQGPTCPVFPASHSVPSNNSSCVLSPPNVWQMLGQVNQVP